MIPPNPPAPLDSPANDASPNPPVLEPSALPITPVIELATAPRANAFTPPTANLELSSTTELASKSNSDMISAN